MRILWRVGWRVVIRWRLRPLGRIGRCSALRPCLTGIWRWCLSEGPRSICIVVWSRRSAVGGRWRRVFRDERSNPLRVVLRGSLVLRRNRSFWRHKRLLLLVRLSVANVGIDGCELLNLFRLGNLCLFLICVPVFDPHEETLILVIHWPMNGPVETFEPLQFHGVQVLNRNAADLSPRSILERIVIKEFASKEETGCQHAVDGAGRLGIVASRRNLLHARCEVEQAKHDGRAR